MLSSSLHHNNSDKPIINKTRKRGCSSSSSSSLVRRYRFKRAILVPMSNTKIKSPSVATHITKTLPFSVISGKDKEMKELSVSARKLAATLWEINNDLPPPLSQKNKKETRRRRSSSKHKVSDPSYTSPIISERMKGYDECFDGCSKRRASTTTASQKFQMADYYLGGLDAISSANFNEVGKKAISKNTDGVIVKNRLKEARIGLSTSKKLLKALNQVCVHHDHKNSSILPLISALRSELDQVCVHMDQVIQDQSSKESEIECLTKHFAEEKAAWKRREREKIRDAISRMAEELEVEKKLRRQAERLNKKIGKEMSDVRDSHLKILKELETEKRAKEILEQMCDELAKGIGEDRAKVEELKRESAKVLDEVEKEREMLQFADVLREERVQMKLSEAKYQFEEKNAVLEKLRNEIEAFLKNKDENGEMCQEFKKIKDLESYLNKSKWGFEDDHNINNVGGDSDSDLHSIELNMDNDSRSYKWSYACENDDFESKRVSIEGIGRKSFGEKIQWGSICFNKGSINIQENSHQFDHHEAPSEFISQVQIQDADGEIEEGRESKCENF